MLKLSLVLPTTGRPDAALELIGVLRRQSRLPDELLVVEQGDAPTGALRVAAERFPGGRHLFSPIRSLPRARNLGVAAARGDIVLFLDDDVEPSEDLVHHHIRAHGDPAVAGVGGRVTGGYDAGDGVAALRAGMFRSLTGVVVRNFHSLWAQDVEHLPGGNMSFKREVLLEVGPFEEAFGGAASLWEETDLCLRLRRGRRRLRFEPCAWVVHRAVPTGGCRNARFEDWLYWHAHNAMLYASRHLRAAPRLLFASGRLVRFAGFAIEHRSPRLLATGVRGLRAGRATYRKLAAVAAVGAHGKRMPQPDPSGELEGPHDADGDRIHCDGA